MAIENEETRSVRCMDFRLEATSNYRNAGGDVAAVGEQIAKAFRDNPQLKALDIEVHRDCGGLKTTARILDGERLPVSAETMRLFEQTFVRHFRGQGFEGAISDPKKMAKMEEFNQGLQKRLAEEVLREAGRPDVKVNVKLATVPIGPHADVVTVVVGDLSRSEEEVAKLAGSQLGHTYIIRGATVDEVSPSLEIARILMGKTDIALIIAKKGDIPAVDAIKAKPYMEGITPRVVGPVEVKKKVV